MNKKYFNLNVKYLKQQKNQKKNSIHEKWYFEHKKIDCKI